MKKLIFLFSAMLILASFSTSSFGSTSCSDSVITDNYPIDQNAKSVDYEFTLQNQGEQIQLGSTEYQYDHLEMLFLNLNDFVESFEFSKDLNHFQLMRTNPYVDYLSSITSASIIDYNLFESSTYHLKKKQEGSFISKIPILYKDNR